MEQVQYNAAIAITGATRGTFKLSCTKNQDLNPWDLEDDLDDSVLSLKQKFMVNLSIYSTRSHQVGFITTVEV